MALTPITERTRTNLLLAFWQLYKVKDIDKIHIQEICEIAGYHRNSFYRYFADVYDILDQTENNVISEILANTDLGILVNAPETTIKNYLSVWENYREYLVIFADESKGFRFQIKLTQALKAACRKLFQYHEDPSTDDYLWEYHINGSVSTMLFYFRRTPPGLSLKEILELQMDFRDANKYPLQPRKIKQIEDIAH